MKKLILVILFSYSLAGYSQITLDFTNSCQYFPIVRLSDSETKYLDDNQWNINHQNKFSLYNLDGTLFKTIVMPPKPDSTSFVYTIFWITRSLFDNDPSNIEYFVAYNYDSVPNISAYNYNEVKIIREDGTILLDEMNATNYYWPPYINKTEDGTKMTLFYEYANGLYYQTKVFSLPGDIPTSVLDDIKKPTESMILYPNPNSGSFYLRFKSMEHMDKTFDLISPNGTLLGTFKSKDNSTQIDVPGLPDGLYLINTRSKNRRYTNKMIIKN